jgi:hypothetical protein
VLSHAQLSSLTIRPAHEADTRSLSALAQLDSAQPLVGDVLVAERENSPLAAIDVISGRLVADPFRRTAADVDLLRARAAQLRSRRRARHGLGRLIGLAA